MAIELENASLDNMNKCSIDYMPALKEFSIRMDYEDEEIKCSTIFYVDAEELKNTIRMLEDETS